MVGQVFQKKRRLLLSEAAKWVGTKENGPNRGPAIELFQRTIEGKACGQSYCMDFVQYCVKMVDAMDPEHPTWLHVSGMCLDVWNRTAQKARVPWDYVVPGTIVIWEHWQNGKPTAAGHTGIVIDKMPTGFVTIEANTSPGPGVAREGDGVYRRIRELSGSDTMKVKGFLNCWDPSV